MAPWAFIRWLHPFTPEDLLISQRIKSSLQLRPSTSQFVLALSSPNSPDKIVYVLSVETLSERSIDDIHLLIAAVNPSSVVAFVDGQYLSEVVEEGKLLKASEGLSVPTSYVDVVRNCFFEKLTASAYETRARLRVLITIFGTTFYGYVFAAREAAAEAQAVFDYLRVPSTAVSSFSDDESVVGGDVKGKAGGNGDSIAGRLLAGFSGLLGGNDLDYLTGVPQRVSKLPSRSFRSDLVSLAAPASSSRPATTISVSPAHSSQNLPIDVKKLSAVPEDGCPSFAAPFYPLFLDLHELFTETPGVNQALTFARRVLDSVERGDEVDNEDLSRARLFRVAVESVRLSWNACVAEERRVSTAPKDFSQLPFEEKCQALIAQALQYQAQKFSTVVAIVDASNVPGIRRHWNTPVPPEVAACAEHCFVALDFQERVGRASNMLENPETKAAVVVGVGAAAAAGWTSLPHWASMPSIMKFPILLKLLWTQAKRQAVSWGIPASTAVLPTVKAAGLFPSWGANATLIKSIATAEKVRVAAHSLVAGAEKASLHAIRTAFYSLMRNRQASSNLGPRPWLAFGGTLAVAAGVMLYGEDVEHAIGIVPSVPAIVRLGLGVDNLEQTSRIVDYSQGSPWWNRVYETLYRNRDSQGSYWWNRVYETLYRSRHSYGDDS